VGRQAGIGVASSLSAVIASATISSRIAEPGLS
jgi:hypothetical protein